jgi:Family of unknown function (DUF6065)
LGILSFHLGYIVQTDPGYDLYITGSPNLLKPGVQPLTAVVETGWSPYTFTMNWKITAANRIVEFEAGEPVCFFFPVQRNLIEAAEVSTQSLSDDPKLAREAAEFSQKRAGHIEDTAAGTAKSGWQRDYFQGKRPSGLDPGIEGHRTKLRLHTPREVGPEDQDS